MNQVFVCGVSQVTPITKQVSKNRSQQTKRRGRRLSIIGLIQPLISFVYGLVIGGVSCKSYIQMMEREAMEAEKLGRMRVIVRMEWTNTQKPRSSKVMVKMGKPEFIHFFST